LEQSNIVRRAFGDSETNVLGHKNNKQQPE